jgi:hypothetical protein
MSTLSALMGGKPRHPYFPVSLKLAGYEPMAVEFDFILGIFALAVCAVVMATWAASGEGGEAARPPAPPTLAPSLNLTLAK